MINSNPVASNNLTVKEANKLSFCNRDLRNPQFARSKSARRAETMPDCHKSYYEKVDYSLKTKFVGNLLLYDCSKKVAVKFPFYNDKDFFQGSRAATIKEGYGLTREEIESNLREPAFDDDDDVESDDEQINAGQELMKKELFNAVLMYKKCGWKIKTLHDMHVIQDNEDVNPPHLNIKQVKKLYQYYLLNLEN
jgi:hypothetical protein